MSTTGTVKTVEPKGKPFKFDGKDFFPCAVVFEEEDTEYVYNRIDSNPELKVGDVVSYEQGGKDKVGNPKIVKVQLGGGGGGGKKTGGGKYYGKSPEEQASIGRSVALDKSILFWGTFKKQGTTPEDIIKLAQYFFENFLDNGYKEEAYPG